VDPPTLSLPEDADRFSQNHSVNAWMLLAGDRCSKILWGNTERLVMSQLARFKIITKTLAVILLLAAVAIGTSWLGIHAMGSMNDDAETMGSAAKRALEAARASTNVITISGAEFQVALDPRPENRAIVRKIVDEQIKLLPAAGRFRQDP
jgi:hypothetical protein